MLTFTAIGVFKALFDWESLFFNSQNDSNQVFFMDGMDQVPAFGIMKIPHSSTHREKFFLALKKTKLNKDPVNSELTVVYIHMAVQNMIGNPFGDKTN